MRPSLLTPEQIHQLPEYAALTRARNKMVWPLSALVILIYFALILTIAFAPQSLGHAIGSGVTSIGMVIGLAVIVFCLAVTGFYVHYANTVLEPLNEAIHRKLEGK